MERAWKPPLCCGVKVFRRDVFGGHGVCSCVACGAESATGRKRAAKSGLRVLRAQKRRTVMRTVVITVSSLQLLRRAQGHPPPQRAHQGHARVCVSPSPSSPPCRTHSVKVTVCSPVHIFFIFQMSSLFRSCPPSPLHLIHLRSPLSPCSLPALVLLLLPPILPTF